MLLDAVRVTMPQVCHGSLNTADSRLTAKLHWPTSTLYWLTLTWHILTPTFHTAWHQHWTDSLQHCIDWLQHCTDWLQTDSNTALTGLQFWASHMQAKYLFFTQAVCITNNSASSCFASGRIYLSFNIFVLSRVFAMCSATPVLKLSRNSEMVWKIKMTWGSSL